MSKKERLRKSAVERITFGELLQVEAASLLGISVRQMKRIYCRYRLEGDAGLIHCSRGRQFSGRTKPEKLRRQILDRYEEIYQGLGLTLAAEKLAQEGLVIDHETLCRWLITEGWWRHRRKRGRIVSVVRLRNILVNWFNKMAVIMPGMVRNCRKPV